MDFLSMHAWITMGIITAIGIILAPIIQIVWILRFLMASYVAACLVFLMPEKMLFNIYASGVYFVIFLIIFTVVEKGRFFDVTAWITGRFSVYVFIVSVLTIYFLCAILCSILPFALVENVVPQEIYDLFAANIFYCAIAPLFFAILFGKR